MPNLLTISPRMPNYLGVPLSRNILSNHYFIKIPPPPIFESQITFLFILSIRARRRTGSGRIFPESGPQILPDIPSNILTSPYLSNPP